MEAKVKRRFLFGNLILFSLLAAAPILRADEKKKTDEPAPAATAETQHWPVKLFQVKYADVRRLANVFRAFGATVEPDADLKVISVRAPKEVLAAIEESLQRLDVPQAPAKNVQLEAYLLTASGFIRKHTRRTRARHQAAQERLQLPSLSIAGHSFLARARRRAWLSERAAALRVIGFRSTDVLYL
jgi:hypothetical protein